MKHKLLIKNGLLVTMEPGMPVLENGAILIVDGVIKECGETQNLVSLHRDVETIIDACSKIIMPGLVNCHTHLPMSMFRGLADDLPLDVWLNEHIFPAEAELNPDSVRKWSLHSCREMLLSGITTCCDGYFYEDQVAEAVAASGMRAVLGQGLIDFPAPGVPQPEKNVEIAENFVRKWIGRLSRILPSIFCHSPYTCSAETLVKAKQTAKALGVLFQIHVAETENEVNMVRDFNVALTNKRDNAALTNGRESFAGKESIIDYLDSIGVLDEQTLLVHAVWVSDKDIELIRKRSSKVVHCPESNMKLASGISPVWKMMGKRLTVGLGTDGSASNNNHDMFGEMDMAAKLQKVTLKDPCVMDAESVLKMATIEGARAIGLDHLIGSIKVGKQADIILLDMKKPHMVPIYNPYSSIVYGAKASDVSLVMVDGEILVKEGKIQERSR